MVCGKTKYLTKGNQKGNELLPWLSVNDFSQEYFLHKHFHMTFYYFRNYSFATFLCSSIFEGPESSCTKPLDPMFIKNHF